MAVTPPQIKVFPRLCESAMPWLPPLLEAAMPRDVARATVSALRGLPGLHEVRVLWDLNLERAPSTESSASPVVCIDSDDLAFASAVIADGRPRIAPHRPCLMGIALSRSCAAVLLELERPSHAEQVIAAAAERIQVADLRLRSALDVAELQGSMARLEHSEQVQRALFAISDLAGSDRDMPELLKGVHAIIGTLMYAENCFIVRLDAEGQMIRFLYQVDVQDPPYDDAPLAEREGSLTWYLLRDGKPLRGDTDQLRKQVSGPLHYLGTDSYDWMGVPLLRDGTVHGAIVLQSYVPGIVYSAEDQALLEFVGSHVLTALERKGNKDELERNVQQRTLELADANRGLQLEIVERQRAEQLQRALFVIAQLATADITEDAFYRSIHGVVGELLNARNFFIALLSEDRQQLEFPYYVDDLERIAPSRPLGRGLSEYVLRHARPLLGDETFIMQLAAQGEIEVGAAGQPAVCWLGVPLMSGDEAIGLITVQSYDPEVVYGPADQELLGFVASQIANSLNRRRAALIQQQAFEMLEERVQLRTHELRVEISERERIEDRLKHEVMHDALTNLPNRGYLRSRVNRVLSRTQGEPDRQCALLYLDIDRFKIINDSLGHQAGDEVLKEVAKRLQRCVREPDLVARLSGDEFVILLVDADLPATAIRVAQRVLDAIGKPVSVAGKSLTATASIGIALGDNRYAIADELVRDADTALYRAKSLGRNRYVMFDASLQRAAIDVLALEGELRDGLRSDEFEPYFQPVVRLATGEVVGNEALLRWNHPTRGVLSPPQFLQTAEDCGAIEAIDWRMFEISCTLATQFEDDKFLTINVSPQHLRDEAFDAHLLGVLARSGLDPRRVLIEVTEGSLLDDPARVRATLSRLREAGVGAALDDFGTGYSSLSYLDSFPLRMLKIDRSFVVELGPNGKQSSTSILIAILALARALGMDVVAEGIETEEQRSALLALGCEFGQGYLLGRPAPLAHWLALRDEAAGGVSGE